MNITLLVKLTSKAWSLKILALLHDGVPGRQAPLIAAAKANRSAFTASLSHLMELGLLERNPGHGHPLRPEFRLTEKGVVVAAMAHRILKSVPDGEDPAILRRNWAVPILAVTASPQRFSTIKSGLGAITDRALSHSLGALEEREWISRDMVLEQRTPFPIYHAINTGRMINQAIALQD